MYIIHDLLLLLLLLFLLFFGGWGVGEGHISGYPIEVGMLSPLSGCGTYVTIFTKTNWLARK